MFCIACVHAVRCDALDGGVGNINERDVVSIESFKVATVEAQALTANDLLWDELLGSRRIFHDRKDFLSHELSNGFICFRGEKEIVVSR